MAENCLVSPCRKKQLHLAENRNLSLQRKTVLYREEPFPFKPRIAISPPQRFQISTRIGLSFVKSQSRSTMPEGLKWGLGRWRLELPCLACPSSGQNPRNLQHSLSEEYKVGHPRTRNATATDPIPYFAPLFTANKTRTKEDVSDALRVVARTTCKQLVRLFWARDCCLYVFELRAATAI